MLRGAARVLGLVTEAEADILGAVVCADLALMICDSIRIGALCIKCTGRESDGTEHRLTFRDS